MAIVRSKWGVAFVRAMPLFERGEGALSQEMVETVSSSVRRELLGGGTLERLRSLEVVRREGVWTFW